MALAVHLLSDKEEGPMGNTTEVRVYRTTDGRLVGEGDPEGAFLAYPIGATVESHDQAAYDKLFGGKGHTDDPASQAYVDDDARDLLRRRQAGDPDAQTKMGQTPVLVHSDLATELADEARTLANLPADVADAAAAKEGGAVARHRLYRTDDGDLVHEGDPAASRLAYAVGDPVAEADVDEVKELGSPDGGDDDEVKADNGSNTPPPGPTPTKTATPAKTATPPKK